MKVIAQSYGGGDAPLRRGREAKERPRRGQREAKKRPTRGQEEAKKMLRVAGTCLASLAINTVKRGCAFLVSLSVPSLSPVCRDASVA